MHAALRHAFGALFFKDDGVHSCGWLRLAVEKGCQQAASLTLMLG
jgi:hypothetical protein